MAQRLLLYNSQMNGNKQISIMDYLSQIDPLSSFNKQYETQRHLRRSFQEEYKIHSFNYLILCFESCQRILTTLNRGEMVDDFWEKKAEEERQRREEEGVEEGEGDEDEEYEEDFEPKIHYLSKNAKRFMNQKQKRSDKFVTSTVGWSHVTRIVEVMEL